MPFFEINSAQEGSIVYSFGYTCNNTEINIIKLNYIISNQHKLNFLKGLNSVWVDINTNISITILFQVLVSQRHEKISLFLITFSDKLYPPVFFPQSPFSPLLDGSIIKSPSFSRPLRVIAVITRLIISLQAKTRPYYQNQSYKLN